MRVPVGGDLALIGSGAARAALRRRLPRERSRIAERRSAPTWRERSEETRLPVRGPALDRITAGMPGQTLRLAAFGRHDIDVGVAGVLGAEGEPLAVGREVRDGGLALEASESAGVPPSRPTTHILFA